MEADDLFPYKLLGAFLVEFNVPIALYGSAAINPSVNASELNTLLDVHTYVL